jgi:hypothetical protein
MTIGTKYVFMVSMDVDPGVENLFNEVYDREHVPELMKVPGVRSVTRMKGQPLDFTLAGATNAMPAPTPIYIALYEIDDPKVLTSPAWAAASEKGRWATQVRPHTRNRSHAVYRVR